ncbi:16S rRNA (adenine(1518)-N(6)/adenine(1519)-N(6))-dimethyltransferase RsmA [Natronogracilivirga saccharolytica]|uniref:Ribosomal RNA small subunit methyltransferase A n=1 Tax=Natronogracilivirga saccharolytica TaxID=2812953 RepID=A0A8J7S938_9BACT|nr:16S rRNA (adenine(1518)-N(6)/adenine(1519)-N(6))-dimethyltransferase RsmA [Natronogracilivirga saccharolytica]MBP3192593.1 ribosomal RNA small subunit methyltransferase A [Natronogracilivirga saccharolytica]
MTHKSFKPKKSLGQHFLADRNISGAIVNGLEALPEDRVIEIGPGTGALTQFLSEKFPDLHVFEVDSRAADIVRENYPGVTVHQRSFLESDLAGLAAETGGRLFVIGNLPYYLTSPILFHVMDCGSLVTQSVFMIQKEVADRIIARPRTRDYGILSVQAQVFGRTDRLMAVSRRAFRPPPKVESTVISYRPGNEDYPGSVADLPVSAAMFKRVVRTAFQQRRKKLSNALKELTGGMFPEGFDAGRRAEELEPREFVALAAWLEEKGER